MSQSKKSILCILDGWGIAPPSSGNAITLASPQTYQHLLANYPNSQLKAAGSAVGLPEGQDGNSETGHLNIGAGRVVLQDLAIIDQAIKDGSFFTKPALLEIVRHTRSFGSRLHLLGMVGESGVHSSNEHLYVLLQFAKNQNLKEVYVHLITDGRDSSPTDALELIETIQDKINQIGVGQIVSIMGRYFAMDRDLRLDRTQKAYDCLTKNQTSSTPDVHSYISSSYSKNVTDEFLEPTAVGQDPDISRVRSADGLIFFNFRTDRTRQLSEMLINSRIPNFLFVSMTRYRKDFSNPILFHSHQLTQTLGEVISLNNLEQLRMAETEKIAMVSYYFNGQLESAFSGEKRIYVDSPKVSTYDLVPGMATEKLVDQFSLHFKSDKYTLGVLNIACPDMVAHTGQLDKTILAIQSADSALSKLVELANQTNSYLVITADHGNAEELINQETGNLDTEHSASKVPLIIYHPTDNGFKLLSGKLGDVAPTILHLLDLDHPSEMTGNILVQR